MQKQALTFSKRLWRNVDVSPWLILIVVALLLSAVGDSAFAQISLGGTPRSFSSSVTTDIDTKVMPIVDVPTLLREDAQDQDKGLPFRFGAGMDVNYSMQNSGTWETLPDGGKIWRLRIVSQGAYTINLIYDMYRLPEGADFYVYSADHQSLIGAFTARNNKEHHQFATGLVKGDNITLEYYEPAKVDFPGEITVSRVIHGYRNLYDPYTNKDALDFGNSGSCNNNVNCPIGLPWKKEIRAVTMILTGGGSRLCTGSMINNVRQDRTPYFLTANHCLGGESTWIIMFNYQSPTCANIDGPTYMTVQGTTRLANYSTSDFGLLLLSEAPPDSYKVVFNGWNNVNSPSDSAVDISHPEGDIKKITFDYGDYTSTDYLGTTVDANASHWRITQWESGTTEPGSSGSPLYDKFHRVIGQLHGGYASCSSITSDYFGKFAMSWLGGGTNASQLKHWLDPDNTGATTLNGFDPFAGVTITHTPLSDTKDSVNAYEVICTIDADTTLRPDSLFLRYELASTWYENTLTAMIPPHQYHAYIPAQLPGTVVHYYLEAHAYNGKADTTDTFTFRVIDYGLLLTPSFQASSGAVGDTVWYPLTLTNDGLFNDAFNLTVAQDDWPTTIWNTGQSAQISSTPTLAPNATYSFKARVIVPPSFFGDADTALVVGKSQGNGSVQKSATIKTTSAGQPLTVPFVDEFPSTTIDIGKWVYVNGATIDNVGTNPPSPPYALRLNGDPAGADTLMSQAINLNVASGLNISFSYEQTGGGEAPDAGDDLFIEYYNNVGTWVTLAHYLGADPDMSTFTNVTIGAPPDAYHSAFRLRIRNTATVGALDDWFVDNVRIDYGPAISATPSSFSKSVGQGDSTTDRVIISNSGQGGLTYTLTVLPDFSPLKSLFGKLVAEGRVSPFRPALPEGWDNYVEVKGDMTPRLGPEQVNNAGGPDGWGYVWVDSDEPGGPTYNWLEISGSGTDVSSGLGDDNFVGSFPIGFGFPFYDSVYTTFFVASNGYIGFGPTTNYAGTTSYANVSLPSSGSTVPKNIVCLCWDDMNILNTNSPGGKVYYQMVGGNLVVEYQNFPEYGGAAGNVITEEVILYPNGNIRLQYQNIGGTFDLLGNTVGIQNQTGTIGLTVSLNTSYIHPNLAVDITKPAQTVSISPSAGDVPAGQADTVVVKFTAVGMDTGVYKSNIKIYSNDPDALDNPLTIPAQLHVIEPYQCGDASSDNVVDISDAVYLIAYIFSSGPAPDPLNRGEVNCDSIVDISDAVFLIAYIFSGGSAPCSGCK